jgi:hypothetical protein
VRIKINGIGERSPVPLSKKLYIASLSHSGDFCADFVESILRTQKILMQNNIDFMVKFLLHDSILERARNMIVADFMSSECTHLLMIDSDQGWDSEKIIKMLDFDKEFISGAVPIKDPNGENYALSIHVNLDDTPKVDKDGLLSASMIGSAFIMLKRELFEKMMIQYSSLYCPSVNMNYYSFFEITKSPVFLGEDVTFCKRWVDMGGEIKIMPDINMTHIGKKVFMGNYHKYLLKQPAPKFYHGINLI